VPSDQKTAWTWDRDRRREVTDRVSVTRKPNFEPRSYLSLLTLLFRRWGRRGCEPEPERSDHSPPRDVPFADSMETCRVAV
jgi:hypothetical protein